MSQTINAPGILDMSMPDYSSSSSSSSDDDNDLVCKETIPAAPVRYLIPAPYRRQEEDSTKTDEPVKTNAELLLERKQLDEKMIKLQAKLSYYESELSRSQKTLAEVYDPELLKRRRSTFQYGCRTCGQFPKRTRCTCPKTSKRRKTDKSNQ